MRFFPSKIILFGEHTLLCGSEGLAIPGKQCCGRWAQGSQQFEGTDLFKFAEYLSSKNFHNKVNHHALLADVQQGWSFESNIPVGYGVGSSGAYCAAVYDRYAEIEETDLKYIREDLAGMESFFHGASSGIDPLISYYNQSIHLTSGQPTVVSLSSEVIDSFQTVDTNIRRQGSFYIQMFADRMQDKIFAGKINDILIPSVNNAIKACLAGDLKALYQYFFEISYFQLVWMTEFIPFDWIKRWEKRLSDYDGFLKICGAGGGGFLIELKKSK
ncbi:MAG: hypothetical protein LCH44_11575 [Bacteroidetes bacterium]|nr:hypothetical protein [Bacteroidota bacterium]